MAELGRRSWSVGTVFNIHRSKTCLHERELKIFEWTHCFPCKGKCKTRKEHQTLRNAIYYYHVTGLIKWTLFSVFIPSMFLHWPFRAKLRSCKLASVSTSQCSPEQSRLVLLQGGSRPLELSRDRDRVRSGGADGRKSKALLHSSWKRNGPAGTRAA